MSSPALESMEGWLPPQSVHTASSFISCWGTGSGRTVQGDEIRQRAGSTAAQLGHDGFVDSGNIHKSDPLCKKSRDGLLVGGIEGVVAPCPCWHALMASARQG